MTMRIHASTKYTAAAAYTPSIVVYNSTGTTAAACDADSSQAATSLLRPLGVLAASVASGGECDIVTYGEATVVSDGTIANGDLLICKDGGAGTVIPLNTTTLAALFADGDPIYVVGRALEAAASGTACRMFVAPYLFSHSEPA